MPDTHSPLTVVQVPIDALKPCPWNPRTWDSEAKKQLRKSLTHFGFVDPLIVNNHPDRQNIIIGGHFRWSMAKELGFTEVPVVYISLTEEKERELNLRLNRNTGSWDYDLLKEFDTSLLLEVGFSNTDLGNIWDDALETEEDGFQLEKELEKITRPQTKPGDLYILGQHRLLCGDSRDETHVKRVTDGKLVDMVYCDPPFNIGLSYTDGISTKGKYGGKTNDALSSLDYRAFLEKTIRNALGVCRPDAHVFYWCDENSTGLIQSLFIEQKLELKRTCLWIKNNFNLTPNVAFNKVYEPCVYATRGKPFLASDLKNLHEVLNKEVGVGNRGRRHSRPLQYLARETPARPRLRTPDRKASYPSRKSPTALHSRRRYRS